MGHLDRTAFRWDVMKRIAKSGCYLEFDIFGQENSYYRLNPDFDIPNDATRLQWIEWLISEGYVERIIISHDTGNKHCLLRYGGGGYHYIVECIVPRMRGKGFKEEHIQAILVDNPRRVLSMSQGLA